MSSPPTVPVSAPRRYTSATLTGGVLLSGLCFVIAAFAEVAGAAVQAGDMTDFIAVVNGLGAMAPWAWATLGSYVVVLTPAVALLVTIAEYASISDRRTVLVAVVVFAILAVSAGIALMR